MPNVLISELTAKAAVAAGDYFIVQPAAGPPADYCLATQIVAFTFSTNIVLTGQTTAAIAVAGVASLPSGPVGFLTVSINGTSVKLPYYT